MVVQKILTLNKLHFTVVQLPPTLAPQYGKFESLIAYMIPDALMEMADTSLAGKTITLVGFSGMGKEAAQAIREVGGGKVVVVENDRNLALTASLNGFEVKSLDNALPDSDFVILMKEQRITLEQMMKAKTNCIFANLE